MHKNHDETKEREYMLTYAVDKQDFTVKYFNTEEQIQEHLKMLGPVVWAIKPRKHHISAKSNFGKRYMS